MPPDPDIVDVLHICQYDVVTGPQLERVRGDIESFGCVLHECKLGRLCAEQLCHQLSRFLDVLGQDLADGCVEAQLAVVDRQSGSRAGK